MVGIRGRLRMKKASRLREESGFTLIELLTTIGILGILSAIATSEFHRYTQRAFDARAENDLHAAVVAEEAYYTDNERYLACSNTDCNHTLPGYLLSLDVQLSIETRDDDAHFDVTSVHPAGEKSFSYSNDTGVFAENPRS